MSSNNESLEADTRRWGQKLLALAHEEGRRQPPWDRWTQKLLLWVLDNPAVKAQAFRFADVLPVLISDSDIARHLRESFPLHNERLPLWIRWGAALGTGRPLTAGTAGRLARAVSKGMARHFIAGEKPGEITAAIERMEADGMGFTLDLLGEATASALEADKALAAYEQLLDRLASWARGRVNAPPVGGSPRVNVSLKLSALSHRFHPIHFDASVRDTVERLVPILDKARAAGAHLHLDMESSAARDLTLAVAKKILERPDAPSLGVVIQAYLKDSLETTQDLLRWLRERGKFLTVRLVKGAYWDTEMVLARQNHWPAPVFTDKAATDQSFERLAGLLFENADIVRPAVASHNARSLARALALAERHALAPDRYEFQMLYGMGETFKSALLRLRQPLRVYAPFGPLIPGMAYLVRRLLENTSNVSFLRHDALGDIPEEALLKIPVVREPKTPAPASAFQNIPPADFSTARDRRLFARAFEDRNRVQTPACAVLVNGRSGTGGPARPVVNPARLSQVLGSVHEAAPRDVEDALAAAEKAFPDWSRTTAEKRARKLEKAAQEMTQRRWALAALEVLEVGKTWAEADADVCEAVDYLNYYAWAARSVDRKQTLFPVPGEHNSEKHVARGPSVVIAPWNFPLGILTGMSAAALAAGNPVLMKPSGFSSLLAQELAMIYLESGIPENAVHLLPGPGAALGEQLVKDPRTALVAFTGSRDVGLRISSWAAAAPGRRHLKKVILELGGKNAIIVDADADLDEAVGGIVQSAYGYQGQKCSALSRLIVLEPVRKTLLDRLIPAVQSLRLGPPEDPRNDLGPLISAAAVKKTADYVALGKKEARCLHETPAEQLPVDGHFAGPAVFESEDPRSTLVRDEIFGPVLTVLTAKNFDEALALARDSEYALTGGLYSRRPAHVERVKTEWDVGNLYINRKITGAVVGRQPFGGFGMSGTGTKAGGPEYLLHFMQPKTITENTLRHGLPMDENEL